MFLPPLVAAFIAAFIAISVQYIGNEKFKSAIDRFIMIVWVKFKRFFSTILLVFFPLTLIILFYFNELTLLTFILSYAIFLTIYALFIKFKRKDVSTVISCRLGDKESENGANGLIYIRHGDGDAIKEIFAREIIGRTDIATQQKYIYFAIRNDLVERFKKAKNVVIIVEFFDFDSEEYKGISFSIQYDSKDKNHHNPSFKPADYVPYRGTNKYQLAAFLLKDGKFSRSQQDSADFRITCKQGSVGKDIYVRRVIAIATNE